jgi:hypothetical protein
VESLSTAKDLIFVPVMLKNTSSRSNPRILQLALKLYY